MGKAGKRLIAAAKECLAMVRLEDKALTGSRWTDQYGTVRVMAVVDGWILARYPRCEPFVTHKDKWLQRFAPLPSEKEEAKP